MRDIGRRRILQRADNPSLLFRFVRLTPSLGELNLVVFSLLILFRIDSKMRIIEEMICSTSRPSYFSMATAPKQ